MACLGLEEYLAIVFRSFSYTYIYYIFSVFFSFFPYYHYNKKKIMEKFLICNRLFVYFSIGIFSISWILENKKESFECIKY